MRKVISDNVVVDDRCSFFNDVYQEIIKKYPFTITYKDGKLVLLHKKMSLVQVVDDANDRRMYKDMMYKYANHCKSQYGAVDIDVQKLNTDIMFDCECLHKFSNKYPMFFGYNDKNDVVGLFGFRKSITLKTRDGEEVNLQEISTRTNLENNTGLAIYGGIAFFMLYAYAMKNNTEVFMSTVRFLRSAMFRASEMCKYSYLTTCKRYVDVFNSDIVLDLWTTHQDEYIQNLLMQS